MVFVMNCCRGAQQGMPREGEFFLHGKDAYGVCSTLLRRDKNGFELPELNGNILQQGGFCLIFGKDNRQSIARDRARCKHVEMKITHCNFLTLTAQGSRYSPSILVTALPPNSTRCRPSVSLRKVSRTRLNALRELFCSMRTVDCGHNLCSRR